MSSSSMGSPQCGESYSFSSGDSSCNCPSFLDYDWDSDEEKEDSRIANGVCSESNTRSLDSDSDNNDDSVNFKTVLLLNAVCEDLREK
eukprot:4454092-Ditylum_brightwellii.AAC.1